MKKNSLSSLLVLALFLGGCLPEERIWWSPNGREAAVVAEGALHLVKADGALGDPLMGGAADKSVTPKALSWLPGGNGFVIYRERKIATWEEMSKLIPAPEADKIALQALAMPALLAGAENLAPQPADADALLSSLASGAPEDFVIALLCAYQAHKEDIGNSLLKLPKGAELLESLNGDDSEFTLYEICLVNIKADRKDGPPQSLARSLHAMSLPKVSPGQNAVAWLQMSGSDLPPSIEVSSLDGRAQLTVCDSAKATFDWSPDGRSILFATPVGGKGDSLAKIQRVAVIQESGALMKKSSEQTSEVMPAPTELGMAILLDPPRLQALPDGRALFASQPATLPATGSGPEINPKLFVVSADGKTLEAVATAPGALPTNLSFFVASPDGKLAAVVESGNDAVAVIDLVTGASRVISPSHPDWRCRTMPAWKSATELTFAALEKPDSSPAWMLWSKSGGVRPISEKWPAQATGDWLKKEKPEQKDPAK